MNTRASSTCTQLCLFGCSAVYVQDIKMSVGGWGGVGWGTRIRLFFLFLISFPVAFRSLASPLAWATGRICAPRRAAAGAGHRLLVRPARMAAAMAGVTCAGDGALSGRRWRQWRAWLLRAVAAGLATTGLGCPRWPVAPNSSLRLCWCGVVMVAVSRGWLVLVVGAVVVLSTVPGLFEWRCCGGDGERSAVGHVCAAGMVRIRAKAFTDAFVGGHDGGALGRRTPC
jgi:hypothetical protein